VLKLLSALLQTAQQSERVSVQAASCHVPAVETSASVPCLCSTGYLTAGDCCKCVWNACQCFRCCCCCCYCQVELELAQMPPGGSEQQLAALREVQVGLLLLCTGHLA
jgi:hypothetical protein